MNNDKTPIWEKRVTSKYGRKETPKQHYYFQQYLQQDGRRSVKRLHDELKSLGEKLGVKTISFKSLSSYCTDFEWVNRANAYDEYRNKALLEEKQHNELLISHEIAKIKSKELENAHSLINDLIYASREAYKSFNDGKISIMEYTKILDTVSKAYDTVIKTVTGFESRDINKIIINNLNGDNNEATNNSVTFHELMNEDLLRELTDDVYLS